jgi:hypothetical protein
MEGPAVYSPPKLFEEFHIGQMPYMHTRLQPDDNQLSL